MHLYPLRLALQHGTTLFLLARRSRIREADCVITFGMCFHGYALGDANNKTCDRVSKGDLVFIPLLSTNRSKELWGEDAMEFK